jgi:hypothetical protein
MVQWLSRCLFRKIVSIEAQFVRYRSPFMARDFVGEGSMDIKLSLKAAAALLAAAGALGMAAADENGTPAVFVTNNNTWSFEVVPYAWLPGLKGDIDVRNYNVDIDQSFSDIFKTVKFASDVLGIARYQDWLIYTQVDYFSLSTSQLENAPARGSLDSKETFYTAAAGYRFNGWTSGQTFDVLAGAQGLNIDNTLTLYGIGRVEKTRSVVDGVFVLRPSFQLSQHWLFNPTLSAGAGDNNYTFQLQPQFQYQFNSTWEIRFGYRKMHYKFTGDRENTLSLNLAGPVIGFGARF